MISSSSVLLELAWVDYLILALYFVFVLGIGWTLKKHLRTSSDFFESGRSLPAWICALGFVGANLGAQEVIGMAASGAKYGLLSAHFYWVGAIPAMVFLGLFMMPFYYGSKVRSVPEYLKLGFDEKTRALNALSFAVMTVFSSGISMFALAKLLNAILGWNFDVCLIASSLVVLVYIYSGGLTSAIYNEVLQFFLIVLGLLPLVLLGLQDIGGWSGLEKQLASYSAGRGMPGAWTSTFAHTAHTADNPIGIEWFGIVAGLGFVLSFGYWCTDFLVIQRAMAAKDMSAARRTPLIATVPKMLMPFLVIVPGLIAIALFHRGGATDLPIPITSDGQPDFNMVMPSLLAKYLPNGLLGVGITALVASFMSGMAGNVTAFNTVWTYDLYQRWFKPDASDAHLVRVGRLTTVVGLLISAACAYAAAQFNNIMDAVQLVFGFVNAPLFAVFLLGMFWKRATGHGAFWGLVLGTASAALFQGCTVPVGETPGLLKGGWISVQHTFASSMAQNFWMAIFAFTGCFLGCIFVSLATRPNRNESELKGLVYSLTLRLPEDTSVAWYARPVPLGIAALGASVLLNLIFW